MTKLSATFKRVDIGEIGLRSLLKSQVEGALGRGGTSASFHTQGTLHSEKEVFRISAMGGAKISANSLNTQFGKSSGPLSREVLIVRSFLVTDCSVTKIGWSSSVATYTQSVKGKKSFITLTNAWLILSARTTSSQTRSGCRIDFRSRPVVLAEPQSCFTSLHQS